MNDLKRNEKLQRVANLLIDLLDIIGDDESGESWCENYKAEIMCCLTIINRETGVE
jgi:hypothetical protein